MNIFIKKVVLFFLFNFNLIPGGYKPLRLAHKQCECVWHSLVYMAGVCRFVWQPTPPYTKLSSLESPVYNNTPPLPPAQSSANTRLSNTSILLPRRRDVKDISLQRYRYGPNWSWWYQGLDCVEITAQPSFHLITTINVVTKRLV